MSNNLLVSVIIPTFNRCGVLKRAVLSAVNQTYKNIEIIIVNDASTDATTEVVGLINDSRLKYVIHEKNQGLATAWNTGIKNSSGEYITFLDDDDEWAPEKISHQLEVFKNKNYGIGLVFTNGYSEYENNFIIKEKAASGIVYNPKENSFFPLRVLISPPSSWMLPSEVVKDIGFFDERMFNWDDGDYLVRVAHKYPLYFLNENLVIWHALADHGNIIRPKLISGKEIFLENNLEWMKKDKEYLFRFYRTLGKDATSIDKLKARKYLLKALRMKPYDLSILSKLFRTYRNGK